MERFKLERMKKSTIKLKVEIDLDVDYRLREGLSEDYLLDCVKEAVEMRVDGRGFNVKEVKLTKVG